MLNTFFNFLPFFSITNTYTKKTHYEPKTNNIINIKTDATYNYQIIPYKIDNKIKQYILETTNKSMQNIVNNKYNNSVTIYKDTPVNLEISFIKQNSRIILLLFHVLLTCNYTWKKSRKII